MRIEVEIPDFRALADHIEGNIAEAATEAMRETSPTAAAEVREQVVGAGLGARLANTWRWRIYPDRGYARHSLAPAGYVWSRAPEIMEAFLSGAQIVPVNGSRYLAIPTANVPASLGSRGKRSMGPAEVEAAFNQDLIIRSGKGGHLLGFVNVIAARNGRGFRAPTKGRISQGRQKKLVLMFTFVPSVRLPKLLDLEGPATRWAGAFKAEFERRIG